MCRARRACHGGSRRGRRGGRVRAAAGNAARARENIAIGEDRLTDTRATAVLRIAGRAREGDAGPVVYRFADPGARRAAPPGLRGARRERLLDAEVEYARAGVPFDRAKRAAASIHDRGAQRGVSAQRADGTQGGHRGAARRAPAVMGMPSSRSACQGSAPGGPALISATSRAATRSSSSGYVPLGYTHIRPLRFYRPASARSRR